MLGLHVIGQLDLLRKYLVALLALVVSAVHLRLVGMHPLEVPPEGVPVGGDVTTDVALLKLLTGLLVTLCYVDSSLRYAPEQISTEAAFVTELLVKKSLLVTVSQMSPHPVLGVCD